MLQGGWTAPGTVSATPVDGPIHTSSPATTLGSAASSAPMALASHALVPLVYWFGHSETRRNPILFERLIRNLGRDTLDKMDSDAEGAVAGILVDTPSSFVTGPVEDRQRLVKAAVEAFQSKPSVHSLANTGSIGALQSMLSSSSDTKN